MNDLTLADKFPPIHSQKGLLSCVPIAFCDAVWWEIQRGRVPGVSKEFKPSVQFVYYNARRREGDQNSNAPVPPSAVMEALKEHGVCDVKFWANETKLYRERPSVEAYQAALATKGLGFEQVPQTLEGIKTCLTSETPFFFCIRFCSSNSWSFEGGEISRTGILTMPNKDETPFRNHAMLAVGLDEKEKFVIARNSYGDDWGGQRPRFGASGILAE